jgi:MtN3 and saliva related transmembrane protein
MQWLGFAGGLMVAFGFVPQIVKVLRTRSSRDLSVWTLLVIFLGGLLYTAYAFSVGDRVFIVINLLATANTLLLLLLKWRYR